jgi:hypothetical protein
MELVRRQRFAFPGRHIDREQSRQATVVIGGEPATDGIAVDAEQAAISCRVWACWLASR